MNAENKELTHKDFVTDQEVRWCPGCGDYAILKAVQKAMPELGRNKEDIVFVSGIGCSSRFPYYMNTYGFHSIHGRAPSVATGVKLANPKLSVWEITGDGDALAIGGNHFIHAIRRNIDFNILLFNNEIYGLTKGQYSPTSPVGTKTKSTPHGSLDNPFHVSDVVFGAGSSFFARVPDTEIKLMTQVFIDAENHKGTSVVEILQNCVIFNDKAHSDITEREIKSDKQLVLEHGKPMIFGKNSDKGIVFENFELKQVAIGENGITEDQILVHNAENENDMIHIMLARMGKKDDLPVAMGVIRNVKKPTYNELMTIQIENSFLNAKHKTLDELFCSGDSWIVK